jgi:hypothetical protein
MSYIDELIKEKLDGDESRVAEIFIDDKIFDELIAKGKNSDWYHFEPKTYDGEYLIKTGSGYSCYQQDRGAKSNSASFSNLHQAAIHYFTQAGYIKQVKRVSKKWWQFWV